VPDYVVPGASLGYTPGYGEAFEVTPNSADGNPVRFEVTIICAIRDGYAICAYAVGPEVSLGRLVTPPDRGQAGPGAVGRPRPERRAVEGPGAALRLL
jgi:hypothetical protein